MAGASAVPMKTSIKVILVMSLGIASLFSTIISVILMILLRQTRTIKTLPKKPGTSTPVNPYDLYDVTVTFKTDFVMDLGRSNASENYFTTSAIPNQKPASSSDSSPSVSPSPADDLPRPPLRYGSDQFGHSVLTPDGTQVIMSFGSKAVPAGFGQITQVTWNSVTSGLKATPFSVRVAKDVTKPFDVARQVGALGLKSLAVSMDGLRLYVGYGTEFSNPSASDGSDSGSYDFFQQAGRIQVLTRTPNSSLDVTSPNASSSTSWDVPSDLKLECPFGARTTGMPVSKHYPVFHTGDQFGETILAGRRLVDGARLVAVRAQLSRSPKDGAGIFIFEEDQGVHKVLALIMLDEKLFSSSSSSFDVGTYPTYGLTSLDTDAKKAVLTRWRWEAIKQDFARGLALGNDTLLCSVTGTIKGQSSAVFCFRRGTDGRYDLHSILDSPSTDEGFGTSMVLDPTGTIALIGSPMLPTALDENGVVGKGGSVYLYALQKDVWVQTDKWTAPDSEAGMAFGHFVNADPFFNVVSANANMDNRLDVEPLPIAIPNDAVTRDPNFPRVYIRVIDKRKKDTPKFLAEAKMIEYSSFPYPDNGKYNPTYMVDPLFGAHASLAVAKDTKQVGVDRSKTVNITSVRVLLASPLNATCATWRTEVSLAV